jgi:replicative DNA helicase
MTHSRYQTRPPQRERAPRASRTEGNAPYLRPLPYNVEAEEAVIGSCILDPDAIGKVSYLARESFHREAYGWMWEALRRLAIADTPPDLITLVDELERLGKLGDVGGPAAISEITMRVPTAIHVEYYGRIVERNAVLRQLIGAAEKIARLAYEESDLEVGELLVKAETTVFGVAQARASQQESVLMRDLAQDALERYAGVMLGEHKPGIPTHSDHLNAILTGGGLQRKTLTVIAARPKVGKTFLMVQMALCQAILGYRVLFFSLEMSKNALFDRAVANLAGVSIKQLTDGPLSEEEFERVGYVVSEISMRPEHYHAATLQVAGAGEIIIVDQRGLSPFEMQGILVRETRRHGEIDVVYTDHLQEVGERGMGTREFSKADIVGNQVRFMRNLAGLHNVAWVLAAQLNRKVEERADKRPILSDFKDSGGVEELIDLALLLYRDEMYNKKTEKPGIAEIIIAAQRNGETGVVDQRFTPATGRWRDVETYRDRLAEQERSVPAYQKRNGAAPPPPLPPAHDMADVVF